MNNSTHITSVLSRLDFPETLLEKFADNSSDEKPSEIIIPDLLETIKHTTSETYSSGNVEVIFVHNDLKKVGYISIPVITPFIFTCTKGNQKEFNLDWSTSLS
jgi:hypothetical protein